MIDSDSEGEPLNRVIDEESRSDRGGPAPSGNRGNTNRDDTAGDRSLEATRYVRTKLHVSTSKRDKSVKAPLSRGKKKHELQLVTREMCNEYVGKDREFSR